MEKERKVSSKNLIFLSVVIPAFNEESVILDTVKSIDSFLESQDYTYEILVANDGSFDNTLSLISNYAKTNKNITILDLPHRGKAPTVIDGMESSRGKYILFTDADNSTPITEVKKLLHYVEDEGYDIAIGSREGTGAVRKNEPFIRHLMGRVFNSIIKLLLFSGVEDTQCGFKLFTSDSVKKITPKLSIYKQAKEIKVPRVSAFDVELLFVAKKQKLKIKSIPVEWTYGEGTKVNNIRDSWVNFTDVIKVWINSKRGKYN